jgi:hypothetical protein
VYVLADHADYLDREPRKTLMHRGYLSGFDKVAVVSYGAGDEIVRVDFHTRLDKKAECFIFSRGASWAFARGADESGWVFLGH